MIHQDWIDAVFRDNRKSLDRRAVKAIMRTIRVRRIPPAEDIGNHTGWQLRGFNGKCFPSKQDAEDTLVALQARYAQELLAGY